MSDFRSAADVAENIGKSIGKPELAWVEFSDEEALNRMTQAGVSTEIAQLYTDMVAGLKNGKIAADFEKSGANTDGKIKLEDFANEYASKF